MTFSFMIAKVNTIYMKMSKFLFRYLFILFIIGCSSDDASPVIEQETGLDPLEYVEELNISYGNDSDQKFDLYLPAGRSSETKTIILVHGGGWTAGDKSDMDPFKDLLRLELPNLAIANINYRLADENTSPFPMQLDDISTVVEFLNARQVQYSIGQDIGFVGTSAGGHLSLLWSYAFDEEQRTKMVCSIVGPTNLADEAYLNSDNEEIQGYIELFGIDPTTEFLQEVSPLHRVTADAPPTILFYGGMDPLIPTSQGIDMSNKLAELNVSYEFTLYPEQGHGWADEDLLDTWVKLKAFTQNNLLAD